MNCYRQQQRDSLAQQMAQEARILGEARMLRDDQALTPELTEAILRRLREYMQRTGYNQDRVARSIGYKSAGVISEVLGGTYAADIEPIVRKLDKWLEAQILRENAPKPAGFVTLEVAKRIIGFTKKLSTIGGLGIITGPSSCGKSLCADYLRSEIPGAILIRITTAGCSRSAVLDLVAQQLRLTGLKLTAYQMQSQIVPLLKGSGRLIIVDEAHKLVVKRRDEGLHCLRDLHDDTECPILFVGTSNFASYIMHGKAQFEAIDQISARTSLWMDISEVVAAGSTGGDGGLRMFSIDDMKKVLAAQQIRVVKDAETPGNQIGMSLDAVTYLCKAANSPGHLRTVKHILLLVQDQFAPGDIVTAEDLDRLQNGRLGQKAYTAMKAMQHVAEQTQRRTAAG